MFSLSSKIVEWSVNPLALRQISLLVIWVSEKRWHYPYPEVRISKRSVITLTTTSMLLRKVLSSRLFRMWSNLRLSAFLMIVLKAKSTSCRDHAFRAMLQWLLRVLAEIFVPVHTF